MSALPRRAALQVSDFKDAVMSEKVADEVMRGRWLFSVGLDWLRYDSRIWQQAPDCQVTEEVRKWCRSRFDQAYEAMRSGLIDEVEFKRWLIMLDRGKIVSVVNMCKGMVLIDAAQFDSDPDLLNTPSGVVDLRTGELLKHDPKYLMTKITTGSYKPGYVSLDWTMALEALPLPERRWLQARLGQGATGRTTPDGVVPVLNGTGENGKSVLTTDGVVIALGDYGDVASAKLVVASKGTEHSTEMADLRGQRLLLAEEMTEGRALDVTTIKRIQDVGKIKARYVHKDNISFFASHSLMITTNYLPVVNEVDHGTWRRLALLRFPFTFRKDNEPLEHPDHRRGDPGLKDRIKKGADGQHDAIVTWVVEGAVRVHKDGSSALAPTPAIVQSTLAWRRTADRILGFWSECLVADPSACVTVIDLKAAFNDWLKINGHKEWASETLTPRFAEHAETRRHRVERRETQRLDGLVIRAQFGVPVAMRPKRASVWVGVRWRTDADATEDADDAVCPPTTQSVAGALTR